MAASPSGSMLLLGLDLRRVLPTEQGTSDDISHTAEGLFLDVVAAHGGVAFYAGTPVRTAMFSHLELGLAAAVAIQKACLDRNIIVPVAVHAGVLVRCGTTYTGPPINRLISILDAGHPGQILLSRSAEDLIGDTLPAEVEIRLLGRHRLRDLVRPAQLFQVYAPGLPTEFPPLNTIDHYLHNLPIQPAPFIGREQEIGDICRLLEQDDVRLVSLVASSGTGKSRLSLQVAADLLAHFEHGVYFIPLASISDARLVPSVIARTLGLKEVVRQDILETLAMYLHNRHLLLVLDNFEQLLAAAPDLTALLQSCPQVKILVTTQERLNSAEEHFYPLQPLALPDPARLPPLEELVGYPSVALFLERAQIVHPAFRLTPKNVMAVAELCQLLDGLPLAIELVAAHSKTFLPQDMLLFVRTRMLLHNEWHKRSRKSSRKNPVLRTVLDWSYELLLPAERTLLARLGVFVGGCTIEAAEAVCNATDDLLIDILDAISMLLDKNLLLQELLHDEESGGQPRFIMLDHIHDYALDRLKQLGEIDLLHQRHASYYLALAEDAEPELRGTQQEAWLQRVEGEHDNLRAAISWGFKQPNPEIAMRICGALWRFWWQRGHLSEGGRWLSLARQHEAGQPADIVAKIYHGSGIIAWLQGAYEDAQRFFQTCLDIRGELDDQPGSAIILNNLGHLAMIRNAADEAVGYLERALAIQEALDDDWGCAYSIINLGNVAWRQQDYGRATTLYQRSLDIRRKISDLRGVAATLGNLGWVALQYQERQQAHSYFTEAMNIFYAQGNRVGVAEALVGLAAVAYQEDQLLRMARLAGASQAIGELLRAKLWPDIGHAYEQVLSAVQEQMQNSRFAAALAEGRSMLIEQAVSYALEQPGSPGGRAPEEPLAAVEINHP